MPIWVTDPYQRIHEDEKEHGNYPFEILVKYGTTAEKQERAMRAVEMSLILRRQYFDKLGSLGLRRQGLLEVISCFLVTWVFPCEINVLTSVKG